MSNEDFRDLAESLFALSRLPDIELGMTVNGDRWTSDAYGPLSCSWTRPDGERWTLDANGRTFTVSNDRETVPSIAFGSDACLEEFVRVEPLPLKVEPQLLESALPTAKTTETVSRDVVIGADRKTGKPVALPYKARVLHTAIVANTGAGKSTLLSNLISADLRAGTPAMVIDPHGDLAHQVIGSASAKDAQRIIHLDPSCNPVFGLNLLTCSDPSNHRQVTGAVNSVIATLKTLYKQADQFVPRLEKYIDLAARTVIPNGLTLPDVPRVLISDEFRRSCLRNIADTAVRHALNERWIQYDQLRTPEQMQHIEAVGNRLDRLFADETISQMAGSPETTVPFEEILYGNKLLIFSLSSSQDVDDEWFDLIGAMVLCVFARGVFARHKAGVKPDRVHLYIDEYERFATTTTGKMLTQGRKFGVGFTFAYQNLSQVTDPKVRGAVRGARTLIVGRVSRPDADEVAGEFPFEGTPEWTDWVKHPTETVDKKIVVASPITWLCTVGHSDPRVIAARDILFRVQYRGEGLLSLYRPEMDPVPIQMEEDDPEYVLVNKLLADVMKGFTPAVLRARLLEVLYQFTSPLREFDGGGRRGDPQSSASCVRHNVLGMSNGNKSDMKALGEWLDLHLNARYKKAFLDGIEPSLLPPCRPAPPDEWFRHRTSVDEDHNCGKLHVYSNMFYRNPYSVADVFSDADTTLAYVAGNISKEKPKYDGWVRSWEATEQRRRDTIEHYRHEIAILRRRMRCVVLLCEGLAEHPIWENSGEQIPKRFHVVHPKQPEQDARNKFAGRLVNPGDPDDPDDQWIAHVRLPSGAHHEVTLAPPTTDAVDLSQVEAVRDRQKKYAAKPRPRLQMMSAGKSIGSPPHDDKPPSPPDEPPPIGRRSPKK